MSAIAATVGLDARLYEENARLLFEENLSSVHVRRDRVFAHLMVVQWFFGIMLALICSPHTYVGRMQSVHVHVYYAVFVGAVLSGVPIFLTVVRPGWAGTRHTVAVAQALWSALLIHLSGGRIETHFHVFGSLAFLAFYRDWKVLMTGTIVVTLDHALRGMAAPMSLYGIAHAEWWRFLEHTFWVTFEDTVLLMGIHGNIREMQALATRQAQLELLHGSVEQKVVTRTEELSSSREQYRALVETTRTVPWRWDREQGRFTYVGPQASALLGCSPDAWLGPTFLIDRVHPDDKGRLVREWSQGEQDFEFRVRHEDGHYVSLRAIVSRGNDLRGFMLDVTEQRRLEFELNQAQKLESVGRLASGIAHEINTPIQFVNDSINFVRDAFADAVPLVARYRAVCEAAGHGAVPSTELEAVKDGEEAADIAYILENVPKALERSIDGIERVATLVRSMKEFAHPDKKEKAPADLNHAISTTLTIARNEYKYVADVETDFGVIEPVRCNVNEVNQVLLNLIVNAAHAIADQVKDTDKRGLIRITTRMDGGDVVIAIADSGGGIPEAIQAKIFEPFFTTKEVGRGTGQGLSIARNVIVDKHGGALTFESSSGVGTTFYIRLPVAGAATDAVAA